MKTLVKIATMALLVGVAALAPAQRMMMMGGGGGSPTMLLFGGNFREVSIRDDVAKELKLTQEQKDKLIAFQEKTREDMMGQMQNFRDMSQEERTKLFTEMQTKSDKAIKEILKEEQSKRLRELWIQRQGNRAIMNPELQKELGLSDEQKDKIKALGVKQQEAMRAIFEKVQNGEIDREETRPLMEKNNKIMDEELGKVLTADQAAKLKAMGGAPFKFDEGGN